jgi:hypothetical protein
VRENLDAITDEAFVLEYRTQMAGIETQLQ